MPVPFPCTPPARGEASFRLRWTYKHLWRVDGRVAGAAVEIRDSSPITAFVGHNGDGKTLCAIYSLLPTLEGPGIPWECSKPFHPHTQAGVTSGLRRVLSTVPLLDPATGLPHPRADLLTSYGQMLRDAYHAEILLDEVQGVADAQDHQSLPAPVRNVIAKMRGRDVRILWTTPDFGNASKRLRTITQAVVHCKGTHKVRIPGRRWRSAQHFRWALFDAKQFDEFNHSKANKLEPEAIQHFWRPGHVVNEVYDTHGEVVSLGIASEGGSTCIGCGGARSKPVCDCPPDLDDIPEGVEQEIDEKTGRRRRRVLALEHEHVAAGMGAEATTHP